MRTFTALAIAPIMALTSFRFSKAYRWEVSTWNRIIHAICDTVSANYYADRWSHEHRSREDRRI